MNEIGKHDLVPVVGFWKTEPTIYLVRYCPEDKYAVIRVMTECKGDDYVGYIEENVVVDIYEDIRDKSKRYLLYNDHILCMADCEPVW